MTVAVISHLSSTTQRAGTSAVSQWHALSGFRSVGLLDIATTMLARPSVPKTTHHAPLNHLATNGGEK